MTDPIEEFKVVSEPAKKRLSDKQLTHYKNWKERFIKWLYFEGKEPDKAEGYAKDTVTKTNYRTNKFMRYVWDKKERYTLEVAPEDADQFIEDEIIYSEEEYSNGHKANTQKALQRLFKWLAHTGRAEEWEPTRSFSTNSGATNPREFLTKDERAKIREAALEYGAIPGYNDLSPEERDTWKVHLAKRFNKKKSEVTPQDWDKANGYKFVSLVWTSLDAGLRPIEVERASIDWIDVDNQRLVIPKEDSSKNRDTWRVPLREDTTDALEQWLIERDCYEKYEDTDALWLTRESNPYRSYSLKYLLENLCELAGIDTEHRKMPWYAIRHSVGTYMTEEKDLKAAQSQLRHKSPYTTMQYDQSPEDVRRDGLNRMG